MPRPSPDDPVALLQLHPAAPVRSEMTAGPDGEGQAEPRDHVTEDGDGGPTGDRHLQGSGHQEGQRRYGSPEVDETGGRAFEGGTPRGRSGSEDPVRRPGQPEGEVGEGGWGHGESFAAPRSAGQVNGST